MKPIKYVTKFLLTDNMLRHFVFGKINWWTCDVDKTPNLSETDNGPQLNKPNYIISMSS